MLPRDLFAHVNRSMMYLTNIKDWSLEPNGLPTKSLTHSGDEVVEQLPKILNVGIQHSEGLLSSSLVNWVTGLRC